MLNFTIKLISDAGFQGEITSISTAAQQIEVFSRILKTSVTTFLNSGEEGLTANMGECAKMVCHGQHTYVYAQVKGYLWLCGCDVYYSCMQRSKGLFRSVGAWLKPR